MLPDFTEGQTFEDVAASVTGHFTSPPKPYTEDTLLSAMENAGKEDIPDEAEQEGPWHTCDQGGYHRKLVASGFVDRKGKNLIPQRPVSNLVTVLPEPLTSPMLTAEWEQKLMEIAKGSAAPISSWKESGIWSGRWLRPIPAFRRGCQKLFAPEGSNRRLSPLRQAGV